jgi:hypothetical protein
VGEVAYKLDLPEQLSDVHDVFHISQLKRGLKPHDKEPFPMDGLDVKEDLTITERPIRILDTLTHGLRGTGHSQCARCSGVIMQRMRHLWKEKRSSEQNIHISLIHPNLEDEIHLKGGRICNTLNFHF